MLGVFRKEVSVTTKSDASPVTEADLEAEKVILKGLRTLLPGVPVITEEKTGAHKLAPDEPLVLVDPLDGTREVIAKQDEFTINTAVIVKERRVAGAVYAPALGQLWYSGAESFRLDIAPGSDIGQEDQAHPVKVRPLHRVDSVHWSAAPIMIRSQRLSWLGSLNLTGSPWDRR